MEGREGGMEKQNINMEGRIDEMFIEDCMDGMESNAILIETYE